MYPPEVTSIDQEVSVPLPDGTAARMTAFAAYYCLGDTKLRVKRAGEHEYITFRMERDEDTPAHQFAARLGTEVNLRDWLALWVYHLAPSFTGSWFDGTHKTWNGSITLADGDPRNLMPENFRLVWHETPFEDARLALPADAGCAHAAEQHEEAVKEADALVMVESGEVEQQKMWLNEAVIYETALRKTKRTAESHADDIVQDSFLDALEIISTGHCEARTKEAVFAFFLAICKNKTRELVRLRKKERENRGIVHENFEDGPQHHVRVTAPTQPLEQF